MTDDELEKFIHVLEFLDSVDAGLTNIKHRGAKAMKYAAERYKKQKDEVPSWNLVAKSLADLTKAEGPATKAVTEINKIPKDKKQRAKLSLADAKDQVKALMPKIQPVDNAVAQVVGGLEKVYKELEMRVAGNDTDLNALARTYLPAFISDFSRFKLELNKLK